MQEEHGEHFDEEHLQEEMGEEEEPHAFEEEERGTDEAEDEEPADENGEGDDDEWKSNEEHHETFGEEEEHEEIDEANASQRGEWGNLLLYITLVSSAVGFSLGGGEAYAWKLARILSVACMGGGGSIF